MSRPKGNHKAALAETKTVVSAENHPRGGLQRDATAEETPRRSGQSQGDTKGEISGPRSHIEAMLAETKTTGESGRTLVRNPKHSATNKNIGVGIQRDATTGETPRRSNQIKGDTKETSPRPKGNHEAALAETKTVGGSGRIFITHLNYSTTEEDSGTLLGKFGPLTETNLPIDQLTGEGKGFAFVTFTTPAHAAAAIAAIEGKEVQGRRLHLTLARAKTTPRRTHQRHATNTAT